MSQSIQMNIKNEDGYEDLYPNIKANNVVDFSGNNPLLTQETISMYGLDGTATPDQVFQEIRGVGAVTQKYLIAAGNNITKGEIVNIFNNEVFQDYETGSVNRTSFYTGEIYPYTSVISITKNKIIIFYVQANGVYCARIGEINNNNIISFGSSIYIHNNSLVQSAKAIALNDTNMISVFKDQSNTYLFLLDYNENNLILQNSYTLESNASGFSLLKLNDNLFLLTYCDDYRMHLKLFEINAGQFSLIQEKILGSSILSYQIDSIKVSENNGYKIFIGFLNVNITKACGFLCEVSSNNDMVVGDIVEISQNTAAGNYISLEFFNNEIIMVFPTQSNIIALAEIFFQENNLEVQKITKLDQYGSDARLLIVGNNLTLTTAYSAGKSKSFIIKFQSGDIQLQSGYQYNVKNQSEYLGVCAINEKKFVIAYENMTNKGAFCGILEIYNNQIGENFINKSKDAIALQDGNEGETIEVIYEGTVNLEWIKAGDTFNSDGVNGVGLLDGILQVSANNTPYTKINIGNYLGTGQFGESNPNMLTFNFSPKILFICPLSSSGSSNMCYAINGTKAVQTFFDGRVDYSNFSWNGKTVSWWNRSQAYYQLNGSSVKYIYIAIG